MRFLIFLLLLFPLTQSAQHSIVELLTSLNSSGKGDFIRENYTKKTYLIEMDGEQNGDTLININGENKKLKLSGKTNYTLHNNILKIEDQPPFLNLFSYQSFEFDQRGNVIFKEMKDPNDEKSIMNEKNIFIYDEQNRLKSLRLIKENMDVNNVQFEAEYDEVSGILPISAKCNIMLEFDINREPIDKGFRFNFISNIPQDLIDMVKEGLGGNPTHEEIMKELGPLGKCYKKYSDIVFLDDNTLKEDVYEEDKSVAGKMDLSATYIFNRKYEVISKKVFLNGEVSESINYEYNDKGKILSRQIGENEKQVNTFDENGNLTKEFTDFGYITRTFKDGKLMVEMEYSFDELYSLTVYKYI